MTDQSLMMPLLMAAVTASVRPLTPSLLKMAYYMGLDRALGIPPDAFLEGCGLCEAATLRRKRSYRVVPPPLRWKIPGRPATPRRPEALARGGRAPSPRFPQLDFHRGGLGVTCPIGGDCIIRAGIREVPGVPRFFANFHQTGVYHDTIEPCGHLSNGSLVLKRRSVDGWVLSNRRVLR